MDDHGRFKGQFPGANIYFSFLFSKRILGTNIGDTLLFKENVVANVGRNYWADMVRG